MATEGENPERSKNDLVREYIAKQKERNNAFYDVMQKFLELPREEWKRGDPDTFLVCEGCDPNRITEYSAELGPYELFVRSDDSHEDDDIYRIDIFHKEGGLAFWSIRSDEAVGFYFSVDGIVREVGGTFVTEIAELKHDLEALVNIKKKLEK